MFAFFFIALAAVLALVGADVTSGKGEPMKREVRSSGDVAPGKKGGGYGGYGGYGYKG